MKTKYFESCGDTVENDSDLDIRFKAVASELFSLSCYGDFILKQAFPQNATGEYLEAHAALRGISRKTPSKAEGEITFYILEEAQSSVEIPSGVICSAKGKPYIQFETLEAGAIPAGGTECTVSARAVEAGSQFNCEAGEVCIMVNAPAGVTGAINASAFSGGSNAEGDASLRRRVCSSYSIPQAGVSCASIREVLLGCDEILDCKGSFEDETYTVIVKTRNQSVSPELEAEIKRLIIGSEAFAFAVETEAAQSVPFDLVLSVTGAVGDSEELAAEAERAVRDLCSNLEIDASLSLSKTGFSVSSALGTGYCEVSSESAAEGTVYPDINTYLELNGVRVIINE